MPRARLLKPGFFKNETLATMAPLARLLYAGLWTLADREGRLEDRPARIKVEVLPYDRCDVDKMLDELYKHLFINRYEVNGQRYIAIPAWKKHQTPHVKEAASTIPAPCESDTGTVLAWKQHHSSTPVSVSCTVSCPVPIAEPEKTIGQLPLTETANPPVESEPIPEIELTAPEVTKPLPRLQEEWFDEHFWPHYWRRVHRSEALKAWRKRVKTEAEAGKIGSAIRSQKAYYEQRATEHRPHAATWLNNHRDEDGAELSESQPAVPQLQTRPIQSKILQAFELYGAMEGGKR